MTTASIFLYALLAAAVHDALAVRLRDPVLGAIAAVLWPFAGLCLKSPRRADF